MKILGTGSAVPRKTVTNDMLSEFLDTSDEWISTRTGIKSRQIITDERFEDLAAKAASRALDASGLAPDDIDYIICSNVANLYITPTLSSLIQGALGIKGPNCPPMDVNAACAGLVLLVCAEEVTRFVDWNDRASCVLFGDAAGAVVVTNGGDDMLGHKMTCVPMPEVIVYCNPMEPTPFETGEGIDRHRTFEMKGREVFRMAVTAAANDIKDVIAKAGLTPDDVDHFLLHQANLRIIESIRTTLGQPHEKFPTNVERCGNTSSASVPLLLDEEVRAGRIKRGDTILFSAFGAGFVTGTALIKY